MWLAPLEGIGLRSEAPRPPIPPKELGMPATAAEGAEQCRWRAIATLPRILPSSCRAAASAGVSPATSTAAPPLLSCSCCCLRIVAKSGAPPLAAEAESAADSNARAWAVSRTSPKTPMRTRTIRSDRVFAVGNCDKYPRPDGSSGLAASSAADRRWAPVLLLRCAAAALLAAAAPNKADRASRWRSVAAMPWAFLRPRS